MDSGTISTPDSTVPVVHDPESGVLPVSPPAVRQSATIHQLSTRRPIPVTRAECLPGGSNTARPCIHSRCTWHLANIGGRAVPLNPTESCVLDVADQGGATLEEVSQALGVVRERVRQIEATAIRKLVRRSATIQDYANHEPSERLGLLAQGIRDNGLAEDAAGGREIHRNLYVAALNIASPAVTDREYSAHINTFYDRQLEIRAAEAAAPAAEGDEHGTE